ncbi:serine/threonine-protein kinase [Actinomadura keratinilytica]|uniref:serine/threonine-protein kinase n=1 Tax=Actinomadura keratinilytica TaxID=547461 RepID=UPI0031EBD4BA
MPPTPRPSPPERRARRDPRPRRDRRVRGPLAPDDPRRIGGYRLLARLGEGGRGVVYLARSPEGEPVAVRLRRGGAAGGRRALGRFRAEAEAALEVTGRHIARVLDAGVAGDRPYIVSEYVEGPTLQRVVEEEGPLPDERLRAVALRTAAGLAAVHRAGAVHRGFTPSEVVLGPDGAKVVGFGAARLAEAAGTAAGPVGAPAYLAPEQIEDEPVGPPADVFAWGAAMVFAATGRPPFGTGPSAAVMRRVTSRRPDLGGMDGPLRDLALRCLDKNPAARPTARQLVRALREGRAPAPKPRPRRIPAYRWRMMVALAVVMAVGFVLGLLW